MVSNPSHPDPPLAPEGKLRFRRKHRLSRSLDYRAVYEEGVRKGRGPIVVVALPNGSATNRLGLSVPRRVGSAVERGRVKRRLREVFRLNQRQMPSGYDLIVAVRPHDAMPIEEYESRFLGAWRAADAVWRKRQRKSSDG